MANKMVMTKAAYKSRVPMKAMVKMRICLLNVYFKYPSMLLLNLMVTKRDEIFMTNIIMPIKSVFLFKNLINSSVIMKYFKNPLADLMRLLLSNLFHPMSLGLMGSLGFMLFGGGGFCIGFEIYI